MQEECLKKAQTSLYKCKHSLTSAQCPTCTSDVYSSYVETYEVSNRSQKHSCTQLTT